MAKASGISTTAGAVWDATARDRMTGMSAMGYLMSQPLSPRFAVPLARLGKELLDAGNVVEKERIKLAKSFSGEKDLNVPAEKMDEFNAAFAELRKGEVKLVSGVLDLRKLADLRIRASDCLALADFVKFIEGEVDAQAAG